LDMIFILPVIFLLTLVAAGGYMCAFLSVHLFRICVSIFLVLASGFVKMKNIVLRQDNSDIHAGDCGIVVRGCGSPERRSRLEAYIMHRLLWRQRRDLVAVKSFGIVYLLCAQTYIRVCARLYLRGRCI